MAGKRRRVLIVDDERTNIRVLAAMLEQDYDISVAVNGEQALRLLASELILDMVLLDIQMPGLSGIEVASRLRSCENEYGINSRVPIVAITGASSDADQV